MRDKRQEMIFSCCDYVISNFEKEKMKEYLLENRNEFVGNRKEFLEFAKIMSTIKHFTLCTDGHTQI